MKKLRYGIIACAMVASGVYLFVYLYRWEWHRAMIAGLIFVAAEIGLVGAAVLDRLRSLERKLGSKAAAEAPDEVLGRIKETAPDPKVNFEWLSQQRSGELSVFVPVLLGAGVVLSGVAWLVERVARATARPAMERGLSQQLTPFSIPVGTLQGASAAPAGRRRSLLPHLAAAAVAILVGTVGIDQLADLTQDRPDPVRTDSTSSVLISISSRPARAPLEAAQALWGSCTTQLGSGYRVEALTDLGGGAVEYVVRPEIGRYAERRLRGCIADGSADRIGGRVVSINAAGR
jgi:hypothetical protein